MALVAGTVTVSALGVESGSGLSLDLYRAMRDTHDAFVAANSYPGQPLERRVVMLRAMAARAQAEAEKHCAFHEASSRAGITLDTLDPFPEAPSGKAIIAVDGEDGLLKASLDGGAPFSLVPSGAGGVTGPVSSTDNAIARWDSTTGAAIQNSLVTVDDTGNIALPALATVDGVDISVLAASVALLGVTAPVDVDTAAAAVGVAITAARSDHKHDVTTAAASTIGTANTEGSSSSLARADHVHDHGTLAGGDRHANAIAAGAAGFMTGADKTKLDGLPTSAAPTSRNLTAGAGLTGGGDLSADRTFAVAAHADGSIVVNPDDVQVGALASDAQHGARGGGTQHANAIAGGAAGFLSGSDKTKLDGVEASAINAQAGAGLTRTGSTLDVVANADGTIVVAANDIKVGTVPVGQVSGLAAVATSGSASDLGTGTLPAGRMPALTGDVTSTVGTATTTVAKVRGVAVSAVAPDAGQVLTATSATDAEWQDPAGGPGGGPTFVDSTVNAGAIGGQSNEASLAVTGQAAIGAGARVQAWLRVAATAEHSADEHRAERENLEVWADDVVAGTGYTLRVRCRNGRLYGNWSVSSSWAA